MAQPQPRANVITKALKELRRMEEHRGNITALDERRLRKTLSTFDQSDESQLAQTAFTALWERDFASFDAAVESLLEMRILAHPESIYVNFALESLHALNVTLATRLNRKAFEADSTNPRLLTHILHNSWHAADLTLYGEVLDQLDKLGSDNHHEMKALHGSAIAVLSRHGITNDEYQSHIQNIHELIRPILEGRSDIRFGTGMDVEQYDDDSNEILLEIGIDLDSEQVDRLDDALLDMLSDRSRVSASLNKSVGVLVRDFVGTVEAKAS
ncbi:hypothetical protein KSP9073_01433 [Kushneria phyllosphaerae]|uniref:Uncharacterized protein n=2 Tax=Kushneria phyllosphaerae TaxID=2100822 RepID=A0A2R8CKW9_9GAMM|nr:hypothetical protein KSP9073_01433 [Kushneria phyllosphaerae]